jgi:hypothetical protein
VIDAARRVTAETSRTGSVAIAASSAERCGRSASCFFLLFFFLPQTKACAGFEASFAHDFRAQGDDTGVQVSKLVARRAAISVAASG